MLPNRNLEAEAGATVEAGGPGPSTGVKVAVVTDDGPGPTVVVGNAGLRADGDRVGDTAEAGVLGLPILSCTTVRDSAAVPSSIITRTTYKPGTLPV